MPIAQHVLSFAYRTFRLLTARVDAIGISRVTDD